MIKAVWIDIDNTLLDFDAYVRDALRTGFERFQLGCFSEEMMPVFHRENGKLWRQIEEGTLTFEELQKIRFRNVFRALGLEGDGPAFEKYFREYLHEYALPVRGAVDMVKALEGRFILCTASNGPYEQQIHRMAISGMGEAFRHHFISEKLGVSKPSPGFYEAGMREMNRARAGLGEEAILPEEVFMLGDSLTSDMAGGIAFGMVTCWFDKAGTGFPGGRRPDYMVTELDEVPRLLENLITPPEGGREGD